MAPSFNLQLYKYYTLVFIETNVLIYCAKTIKYPINTLRIITNLNDLYIAYCMIILYNT